MAGKIKNYPISKMAIIVTKDLWFGLSRMFASWVFSSNKNILVTKDRQKAEAFIFGENRD